MVEDKHYDIRYLTNTPEWKIYKENCAAYGLIPILQDMGPAIRGVEIGVCLGINSYMLLETCPNIAMITGVDHYEAYKDWDRDIQQFEQDFNYEKIRMNMEYMGPRFSLIREHSHVAADEIEDDSLDFVFIDGDHSMKAVLNDLDHYWPKIKKDGIMAGHDSNLFSVNFSVTSWTKRKGLDISSVNNTMNTAWWFRKP